MATELPLATNIKVQGSSSGWSGIALGNVIPRKHTARDSRFFRGGNLVARVKLTQSVSGTWNTLLQAAKETVGGQAEPAHRNNVLHHIHSSFSLLYFDDI